MKRFKFVGDPSGYSHKVEFGRVYDGDFYIKEWSRYIEEEAYLYPDDWEEVQEQKQACNNQFDYTNINTGILPRIPNQDQPASSMTKFEIAVFMAMQGFISAGSRSMPDTEFMVSYSIEIVKETFKKLENEKNRG